MQFGVKKMIFTMFGAAGDEYFSDENSAEKFKEIDFIRKFC